MYVLEAAIAAEPVLRILAHPVPTATIRPLGHGLWLLPLTDSVAAAFGAGSGPGIEGFENAPAGFGAAMAASSMAGPVAYVEAGFFGGTGTQAAQVWAAGAVALGPFRVGEDDPFPPEGSPISRALRHLGVVPGDHVDEFAAVGLTRHRHTNDWLTPGR